MLKPKKCFDNLAGKLTALGTLDFALELPALSSLTLPG
jgi:hypothetical protein